MKKEIKTEFHTTREVIRYCQKYIKDRTLDFGAGRAKYRELIQPFSSQYVTFDAKSGSQIEIVGDVCHPPFSDNEFETIISTQVLEHVSAPWLMVKEIFRILKPRGNCILTTPFLVPFHPDPGDYFRYTSDGLKVLFKEAGFEIIECNYYGKFFGVMAEFFHFIFFDPYKKPNRLSFKIVNLTQKIASFLDRFVKNDKIYANVYIIAQKPYESGHFTR